MPILPIIDLLILMGWSCLAVGATLKAVAITTRYRPDVLGLGPIEMLWISGIFLLLALTLAARIWVKANEPKILAERRAQTGLKLASRMNEDFSRPETQVVRGEDRNNGAPEELAR